VAPWGVAQTVRQERKRRRTWLDGQGDWEARATEQAAALTATGDAAAQRAGEIAATYAAAAGVRGELAILDGEDGGWRDVARAMAAWRLRIAIEVARYRAGAPALRAAGAEAVGVVAALAACESIATGRANDEAQLGELLAAMHKDTRMVRPAFWTAHPVAGYVARLVGVGPIGDVKPPYRAIFDQWKDDRQIGRALAAACDYHVAHMAIATPGHDLADGPFGLLPFEVLAAIALRRRAGLAAPAVDHELMPAPVLRAHDAAVAAEDDPVLAALTAVGLGS
jgi:hypothetical protein